MGKNVKILIVEDDDDINNLLNSIFISIGYEVRQAFSGTEALLHVRNENWDAILLDIMLPGIMGEELILKIREITNAPVIVISAKNDRGTKFSLLNDGADDFIEKPFDPEEVIVRVNSNLRRYLKFSHEEKSKTLLSYKEITLNRDTKEVKVGERDVKLRHREFEILELLIMYPSKIFSKENIFETLWKEAYLGDDNSVMVHLSRLRAKLSLDGKNEDYIETIWGIGYRMKK